MQKTSEEPKGINLLPGHTPSTRPDIEHWWAVEAMIASYNRVYRVTYNTKYETHGSIGVSIYGNAPIASFQYEFLALSEDTNSVLKAVLAYPRRGQQYIIDVFHPQPSSPDLKREYTESGFEFVRTGMILGLELPARSKSMPVSVHKVKTLRQAETANHTLAQEGERIHLATLRDAHIHSFYATMDGEAAGWTQLVTLYPGVAYIHQLYVLKAYRRRKLGTALIQRAHQEALTLGWKYIVLIPSEIALPLYRRLGYRPLVYFSVFRPQPE